MGSSQQTAQVDHQMEQDVNRREEHGSVCSCSGAGMQECESPSCFYEGLFGASRTSTTPVPLAAAFTLCPGLEGDVVKQGYLGKLERNQRRYFVLRTGSHTGPSRLEWFKTQEKFKTMEKLDGKTSLFRSRKQRLVKAICLSLSSGLKMLSLNFGQLKVCKFCQLLYQSLK